MHANFPYTCRMTELPKPTENRFEFAALHLGILSNVYCLLLCLNLIIIWECIELLIYQVRIQLAPNGQLDSVIYLTIIMIYSRLFLISYCQILERFETCRHKV